MKIIDRYILKEFFLSFIYCITTFIFLYIIGDLFNYIDEMIRNQASISTIFFYYITLIPIIFIQTTPMAVLLATIYTFSSFKKFNELIAMRVSGISPWRILRPIIFAVFLLCISVVIVNEKVVPKSIPVSDQIKKDIKEIGKNKKTIIKNVTIFAKNNQMIYAKSFDVKRKVLKDVIIHQTDDKQNLIMKLSAKNGYWKNGKWIFENGVTYRLDEDGDIIGVPQTFKRKIINLKEKPEDFAQQDIKPEFMSYKELKNYIERFPSKSSTTKRRLLVDLYYKTSFPFISLVVIFVASPLAFAIQRGGLMLGLGISILIGLLFYGIQAISLALGKAGILKPLIAAWLPNILFLVWGLYLMKKNRFG